MSEWRELAHRHRLEMHFPMGSDFSCFATAGFCWFPPCLPIWMKLTFRSCTPCRWHLLYQWSLGRFGPLVARLSLPFPLPVNTSPLLTRFPPRTTSPGRFAGTRPSKPRPDRLLCALRGGSARPDPFLRWAMRSGYAYLALPLSFLVQLALC